MTALRLIKRAWIWLRACNLTTNVLKYDSIRVILLMPAQLKIKKANYL